MFPARMEPEMPFCRSVGGESCGCPDCEPWPVDWRQHLETERLHAGRPDWAQLPRTAVVGPDGDFGRVPQP
jgi:hypothetical protein